MKLQKFDEGKIGNKMKTLIIDGNNLLFRGHGKPPMTHNSMRTEAIYICLNLLRKYLVDFSPNNCIVVWDGGRDKKRTDKFSEYKVKKDKETAVEKKQKKILFAQADIIRLGFELFGITQYRCKGREADDLIFTLIKNSNKIDESIVVSTDGDMYQLFTVKNNLIVYSPMKGKIWTKKNIEEYLGFPIKYFVTYKALVGDRSDNLPGVARIGEKKARRLIEIMQMPDEEVIVKEKDLKLLSQFLDQKDEFTKMVDLIKFREVSEDEMKNGMWKKTLPTTEMLHSVAHEFLEVCGFNRYLNDFISFIDPFEKLWRKTNETN